MLKAERDIYFATRSIESFTDFAQLTSTSETTGALVEELFEDPVRCATAAALLYYASPNLPTIQREGILNYTALVFHSDDVLDSKSDTAKDPQMLLEELLKKPVVNSRHGMRGWHLYEATMNCFPDDKRNVINDYLVDMIHIHATGEHIGKPGTYGFEQAREYKYKTNIPTFATGLQLAQSSIPPQNFAPIFIAGQYIDDAGDWHKDNDTLNLFIGMAYDVWQKKDCPDWQDFDYLMESARLPDPLRRIKDEPMIDTRAAYRRAFFSEFKGASGVPLAGVVKLSGALTL
ncbi:hypothetical protein A2801_01655 [Candidatus Woesebacteria bacterium RIFCSPHIGHO2_01_FULL_41_10]|uniref:Uncharacterized protein n=1 Tax=Candidatus Woesebacteria bacterium RIFCSPHIGHO2_01_FULL_41_10 TaxID=1802500 RepID=A0A1F7YPZ2_9BACT|nr:MAG: hypothetical protein A2801_01655 [Candidatus Woesebacteria bacterium RIFCSPHIGHO2_01_FULL_41_10]